MKITLDKSAFCYCLNPERPTPDTLEEKCDESAPVTVESQSDRDLKDAAEFRDNIHAEALRRVQCIRPHIKTVVDRYSVGEYFQQVWDYPGAWYTVVAIPKGVKSREALIDTIMFLQSILCSFLFSALTQFFCSFTASISQPLFLQQNIVLILLSVVLYLLYAVKSTNKMDKDFCEYLSTITYKKRLLFPGI